jgi:TonB family protein
VPANEQVTLRFTVDVSGSASAIEVLETRDNAFGASAVDAMRAASPFPPIPEAARCLARLPITAKFRNPL